jgi:hypothetical protein
MFTWLCGYEKVQDSINRLRLEILTEIKGLRKLMADVSHVLNEVADGLRGPLATSIQDLINENASLREQNATLSGEDAAESEAAANVKAAFDEVAAKFAPVEEVPDVPPLDENGGTETEDAPVVDDSTDESAEPTA